MKVIFNLQIIGMLKTTSRKWRQNNILVSSVKNGLEINCSQLSLCTLKTDIFCPPQNGKMPSMFGLEWDLYCSLYNGIVIKDLYYEVGYFHIKKCLFS